MNKNKIKMMLKQNKKIYSIVSYIYVFLFEHKRLEKKESMEIRIVISLYY